MAFLLPPASSSKKTLVLDLDYTLVYTKENKEGKMIVVMRPGLDSFLKEMSNLYELVLWTNSDMDYANNVLMLFGSHGEEFSHRISSQDFEDGDLTKDLSKLGRELKHVIMVDDDVDFFLDEHHNNVIFIKKFRRQNHEDCHLQRVGEVLKELATVDDVRSEIRSLRNQGVLDAIKVHWRTAFQMKHKV